MLLPPKREERIRDNTERRLEGFTDCGRQWDGDEYDCDWGSYTGTWDILFLTPILVWG